MTSEISTNPATGERVRWLVGSADSGGRLIRADLWCRPGGGVPHAHVHPNGEERFELLAGRLGIECGGKRLSVGAGEHLRLPAGIPHRWWVEGDEEVHVILELDDPRAFELQLETFFALGRHGVLGEGGRVPLLIGACLSAGTLDTMHLAFPPVAVQRVVLGVLAAVARATGHARTVEAARREARERLAAGAVRPAAVQA